MKDIFILRAVSGSGKSTLAESIRNGDESCVIVCADDFFTRQDGSYHFDATLLHRAHVNCQWKFIQALKDESITRVIVANTNTSARDFKFYKQEAQALGHRVFFMVVENRHGNSDVHGVPDEVKKAQGEKIRNSLTL